MCGIAGRFNFDPLRPSTADVLAAMTDAVAHRGPDAAGYHLGPGIGLGHRRLSIIDLVDRRSAAGQRGRHDLDRSSTARSTTSPTSAPSSRRTGHRFRTALRHRGHRPRLRAVGRALRRALPRHVRVRASGTTPARRLLLARDRLGVKPLYYAELPGRGIVFGSELKSLLEDPDVPREWRPEALDAYLTLLYIPAPATIYKGIHKLEPGHVLVAEKRPRSDLALLGPRVHRRRRRRGAKRNTSNSSTRCCASPSRCGRSATCRSARSSPAASTRAPSCAYMVETSARPPC